MVKLKPIKDQVVVLVGVTSGIGLETARRFAGHGARLVLAGRGHDDLNQTREDVLRAGAADAVIVEADVANFEQVQSIAQAAISNYGGFDTWAHIAGVSYYATIEDTPPDEFRRVIDVNLNGPTWSAMAALPHLKKNGGALIIVSSVDARVEVPFQGAYVAAKHGLDGMIDTLRVELMNEDAPVSVTNILPSSVDTPFFTKAKTRIGVEPTAMPPIYKPEAVADAILYAAEHPVRELKIGSPVYIYPFTRRVSSRLYNAMVRGVGFQGQKTAQRKTPDARNQLYEHMEGFHTSGGELGGRYSYSLWLQTHPVWRMVAMGLVIAIPVAFILYRRDRRRRAANRFWMRALEAIGVTALLSRRRAPLPRRVMRQARRIMPTNIRVTRKESMPQKWAYAAKEAMPKDIFSRREPTMPEKMASIARDAIPTKALRRRQPSITERVVNSAREGYEKGVAAVKERI